MPPAIGLMVLGMRVSLGLALALALSLPASMLRELIVGITYMVFFSIVGQGLTIGPLVRWLGVGLKPDRVQPASNPNH